MTFSEEVKEELKNKVEMLPIKKKRDLVEEAMRNGTDITVPLNGPERDKRAMIKGAFLGNGLISDPYRSYHLEFRCRTIDHGRFILVLLADFDIKGKLVRRKSGYGVYIKSSDDIVNILNIMGAHKALFRMEDARIYHELKENVNRKVNCETANIKKTADSAARQIADIKIIENHIGIDNLDHSLNEAAILRMENPESSLEELGQLIDPPISKSGMNHRFRKIHKIAMEYENE